MDTLLYFLARALVVFLQALPLTWVARFGQFVPVFQCATTYRGLRQPSLNRLMQSLRERSTCRFFERRTEGAALKACMSGTGLLLGLLADQRVRGGVRLPFLGHECSTS